MVSSSILRLMLTFVILGATSQSEALPIARRAALDNILRMRRPPICRPVTLDPALACGCYFYYPIYGSDGHWTLLRNLCLAELSGDIDSGFASCSSTTFATSTGKVSIRKVELFFRKAEQKCAYSSSTATATDKDGKHSISALGEAEAIAYGNSVTTSSSAGASASVTYSTGPGGAYAVSSDSSASASGYAAASSSSSGPSSDFPGSNSASASASASISTYGPGSNLPSASGSTSAPGSGFSSYSGPSSGWFDSNFPSALYGSTIAHRSRSAIRKATLYEGMDRARLMSSSSASSVIRIRYRDSHKSLRRMCLVLAYRKNVKRKKAYKKCCPRRS